MNQTYSEYLDFESAVTYLNTTSSTLYKWLQSGKVPAHKLGRQWRFIKNELDHFLSDGQKQPALEQEIKNLSQKLSFELNLFQPGALLEKIFLDAYKNNIRNFQIQPKSGQYEIVYRNLQGRKTIGHLSYFLQQEIKNYFWSHSYSTTKVDDRRFFLNFQNNFSLQIRMQNLNTVGGDLMTFSIFNSENDILSLEKISSGSPLFINYLKKWCRTRSGLIAVTGGAGSGKTTTLYSIMKECISLNLSVFTVEENVHFIFEGVHQIELGLNPTSEKFKTTLNDIMNSDPDVIVFGLGYVMPELESEMMNSINKLASSGHKVILQMYEDQIDSAYNKLNAYFNENTDSLLTGLISQKLVFQNQNIVAEYNFKEGSSQTTQ